MNLAAVQVTGVAKRFGDVTALHHIDLAIQAGEFVSLLGPSGCGKTTLLRIIAGFEMPSAGRVAVHGEDITNTPPERRPTNLVFQRAALFPHMTVSENVGYSLRIRKWPKARIAERVEQMLALVDLQNLGERRPTELSGGQLQRAALARALAAGPKVLLLDEPLSALDLKLRQRMQLELRAIQRKLGATFLYVTHDQTEALVMSDRIVVMNAGRVVQQGTPREIYTRPASVFAAGFIGETNLLAGTVVESDGGVTTVALPSGKHLRALAAMPLTPGMRATVSVRPEAVRVSSRGAEAEVVEVVYLGDRIRVAAALAPGELVWADLRDEEARDIQVGSLVDVRWDVSAANVWQEEPR